jgi:methylenetetrahydrofolate reductase (NADPH)
MPLVNSSMRIDDLLRSKRPTFSFEFMAPRSNLEVENLIGTVADLARLEPDFVCVTCRPASRDVTVDLVIRIQRELGVVAMAHLVCVGATSAAITALLDQLKSGGVENVLALRGDLPPEGAARADDLEFASDLTALISDYGNMCIGGACYPEKHPESVSLDDDLTYIAQKVRSGASFLITQLYFDNGTYFGFVDKAAAYGITVPILPGIMPITHFRQLARIKEMGATIPPKLQALLLRYEREPNAIRELGIAWASVQCADLLERGAPGIHFYTFNRSPATRAILGALRAMGHDKLREVSHEAVTASAI